MHEELRFTVSLDPRWFRGLHPHEYGRAFEHMQERLRHQFADAIGREIIQRGLFELRQYTGLETAHLYGVHEVQVIVNVMIPRDHRTTGADRTEDVDAECIEPKMLNAHDHTDQNA